MFRQRAGSMLLGVVRSAVFWPCTVAENPMRLKWNSMESPCSIPKLALCNFMKDVRELRSLAASLGLAGVDWTFTLEDLPRDSAGESRLADVIAGLEPLEIRYHCAFEGIDLGDADPRKAAQAMEIFKRVCRVVSRVNGRFMTIHMGLGRASMNGLLWDRSLEALRSLVQYAEDLGVCVCLENLASGWSSRPELFERLIRKTGAGITLDIGHATVSHSVESQGYKFEDFALPNADRVFNAHIYHLERDGRHLPPGNLSDLCERLTILSYLPCEWWVLELREGESFRATHDIVKEFIERRPAMLPRDHWGIL